MIFSLKLTIGTVIDKLGGIKMQHDKETLRHFVLWAKGHYSDDPGKLTKIIAEITGVPIHTISESNKIYWLRETCREYGIDSYDIISNFLGKSYGLCEYGNEIEQMIAAMRSELTLMKVKEELDGGWVTIHNLGKANLFEEEK
jgi:hypothetical protein